MIQSPIRLQVPDRIVVVATWSAWNTTCGTVTLGASLNPLTSFVYSDTLPANAAASLTINGIRGMPSPKVHCDQTCPKMTADPAKPATPRLRQVESTVTENSEHAEVSDLWTCWSHTASAKPVGDRHNRHHRVPPICPPAIARLLGPAVQRPAGSAAHPDRPAVATAVPQ
jgi:hypothetical protein